MLRLGLAEKLNTLHQPSAQWNVFRNFGLLIGLQTDDDIDPK